MDLTGILAELAKDLKITWDTEVTTAEGIRSINRAVDDMSRHLPRERIYELTWIKDVTDDSFTTPAALDVDYVVDAEDISSTADGDTLTITSRGLDVPRPLAMLLTDADDSVTELTLIIKGIDGDGVYREETFYRHNGKSQIGKVYFSWINEAEVHNITGNGASDVLDVGTADPDTAGREVWVWLNQPIEPGTESIYSGAGKTGTKYTKDTDYEIDYIGGRIRLKSGGSMSEGTTYYANYERNAVTVDISSIIPELIRINKVLCPADKIPQQSAAFSIWRDNLIIGSQNPRESQKALVDKDHIAIYYEAKHAPPTYYNSGSYPEHLDQIMMIGAAGYVLLVEALQYEFQTSTDLASARTELGLTTAIHVLADAALDKVATYLENNSNEDAKYWLTKITTDIAGLRTAVTTALDAVNSTLDGVDQSDVSTYLTAAGSALDDGNTKLDTGDLSAVATWLTDAETALDSCITYLHNNAPDDAADVLANVTDDIADLRTALVAALDAANTYLDEVDTTDLGQATVGAEGLLETGDDTIDQLNTGKNVPEIYAEYSRVRAAHANARTQAAIGFIQEAGQRIANIKTYIEESGGWVNIALGLVREAEQRIQMAYQVSNRENVLAIQANGYISEGSARMYMADRIINRELATVQQALGYVQEAAGRMDNLRSYIEQASGWMRMGEIFITEAQARTTEMQVHLQEAERWEQVVDRDMLLSDRFRLEGNNRLAEFRNLLANRAEYRKRVSDVSVRQPK